MDVVKQTIRKEGLLGLYAGMESTFWRYVIRNPNLLGRSLKTFSRRHFWWNGGYFGCIFQVRSMMPKAEVRGKGQL
jgi:solute carrier family 25 2-oxodicarboxylate transporter 21